MASEAKSTIGSFREVVQDLLVPELKALKVSMDSMRSEMNLSLGSLSKEMQLRDEMNAHALRSLSEKLDFAIDIRERLASLEARMPRQ
jgi:hypothetical protein